jgi:hypothetical protein
MTAAALAGSFGLGFLIGAGAGAMIGALIVLGLSSVLQSMMGSE